MKPKTKKTIIVVAALAAIAVIVWLVFFRKKSILKDEINNLTVGENIKEGLLTLFANYFPSGITDEEINEFATAHNLTYRKALLILALREEGYTVIWDNNGNVTNITRPNN